MRLIKLVFVLFLISNDANSWELVEETLIPASSDYCELFADTNTLYLREASGNTREFHFDGIGLSEVSNHPRDSLISRLEHIAPDRTRFFGPQPNNVPSPFAHPITFATTERSSSTIQNAATLAVPYSTGSLTNYSFGSGIVGTKTSGPASSGGDLLSLFTRAGGTWALRHQTSIRPGEEIVVSPFAHQVGRLTDDSFTIFSLSGGALSHLGDIYYFDRLIHRVKFGPKFLVASVTSSTSPASLDVYDLSLIERGQLFPVFESSLIELLGITHVPTDVIPLTDEEFIVTSQQPAPDGGPGYGFAGVISADDESGYSWRLDFALSAISGSPDRIGRCALRLDDDHFVFTQYRGGSHLVLTLVKRTSEGKTNSLSEPQPAGATAFTPTVLAGEHDPVSVDLVMPIGTISKTSELGFIYAAWEHHPENSAYEVVAHYPDQSSVRACKGPNLIVSHGNTEITTISSQEHCVGTTCYALLSSMQPADCNGRKFELEVQVTALNDGHRAASSPVYTSTFP